MNLTFTALPESPLIRVTREDGTAFSIHSYHITGKLGTELKALCASATWEASPRASRPSPLTPGRVTICADRKPVRATAITPSYSLEDLGL